MRKNHEKKIVIFCGVMIFGFTLLRHDARAAESVHISENKDNSKWRTTGCCAENLAKYQTSVTQVMDCWKESSGHNANMISKYPTSVAISVFVKAQKNDN